MIAPAPSGPATLADFEQAATQEHLVPLWTVRRRLAGAEPYLWRWPHVRQRILQAADLVPLGGQGAERRVLLMLNPGLPADRTATTETLLASVQLIHGREMAPSHRHTAAALRFVMEGQGACTVVNGQPVSMDVGDLVLTPGWCWHGHFSEHEEPMIWMDGLDAPLLRSLAAMMGEEFPTPDRKQPLTAARDDSLELYGAGVLQPIDRPAGQLNSPLLSYPWQQTEDRLNRLAERDGSPFDGLALQYTNPTTGGPVLPTIDCWIQMLRRGEHTQAHRHTGGVIYNVARGAGWSVINGQRFDWSAGDVFCVPGRAWHEHANASAFEPAILFSINDSPVLRPLGLYREEPYQDNGGRQAVTSTFV